MLIKFPFLEKFLILKTTLLIKNYPKLTRKIRDALSQVFSPKNMKNI